MSATACGSIENTVESDPCFRGRFKAILHEPTEALKINRYIHLNPVRIAALGGHETRDVAAQEITAQLARRRVDSLEQFHWSSYAFFAGTQAAPAWLCTESILAFFGPGSQCELQKGVSSTVAGSDSHRTLGDGLQGAS